MHGSRGLDGEVHGLPGDAAAVVADHDPQGHTFMAHSGMLPLSIVMSSSGSSAGSGSAPVK